MDQLINALLTIDKAHTVLERALDCGPGLGGLNQAYGLKSSKGQIHPGLIFWGVL